MTLLVKPGVRHSCTLIHVTVWPQVDSHEKSIDKGRFEIVQLLNYLDFKGSHDLYEDAAIRFYTLALNKGFTKGRKIQTVRDEEGFAGTPTGPATLPDPLSHWKTGFCHAVLLTALN
jgi:hypothetical protein